MAFFRLTRDVNLCPFNAPMLKTGYPATVLRAVQVVK